MATAGAPEPWAMDKAMGIPVRSRVFTPGLSLPPQPPLALSESSATGTGAFGVFRVSRSPKHLPSALQYLRGNQLLPQTPSALILPSCFPGPWLDCFRSCMCSPSLIHTLTHILTTHQTPTHRPSHSYTHNPHTLMQHSRTHKDPHTHTYACSQSMHTHKHLHMLTHTCSPSLSSLTLSHPACLPFALTAHHILQFYSPRSILFPFLFPMFTSLSVSPRVPFPLALPAEPLTHPCLGWSAFSNGNPRQTHSGATMPQHRIKENFLGVN